jgi:uncharacterized protein YdeI (YjbR/CyaY-like superfamily)
MVRISDLPLPVSPNGKQVITPPTRRAWRDWLATNGDRRDGLWIVYRKKSSAIQGPSYDDLVEEALCFGWIDSQNRRVDDERSIQWFSPRRKGGIWSALNKQRIERLTDQGLIAPPGQAAIDAAKADGSWSQADGAEALIVPPDLDAAMSEASRATYEALPNSAKQQLLWSVYSAKRLDTRRVRVERAIKILEADEGG